MTPRERLSWLREGPRSEAVTLVAFLVAIPLGTLHWIGLAAGGALLGLLAPSLRRALVLGTYLGVTMAVVFVAWLWLFGVLGKATATGQIFGLSLAVAVVVPILGSGVRGLG